MRCKYSKHKVQVKDSPEWQRGHNKNRGQGREAHLNVTKHRKKITRYGGECYKKSSLESGGGEGAVDHKSSWLSKRPIITYASNTDLAIGLLVTSDKVYKAKSRTAMMWKWGHWRLTERQEEWEILGFGMKGEGREVNDVG